MKNNLSNAVYDWIKKADSDFGFASAAFKEFDEFYSQMCILCHDAVEKYLKAYLVSKRKRYKKIHDLVTLLRDCTNIAENQKSFAEFEEGCRILNNYYTPLKYPSHFPFAVSKQAEEAIKIAEEISKFIKSEIL
jgi:HEPN domain-containing protein